MWCRLQGGCGWITGLPHARRSRPVVALRRLALLWLVDDLLASGQLERVLEDYAPPSVPLNMLIVPERSGIARVRLLIDFLAEGIARLPGIEKPQPGKR